MSRLHEEYRELLALTQIHLLQENKRDSWLTTDPETFAIFKKQALQQKKTQIPPVSQIPPPPRPPQPQPIPTPPIATPPKLEVPLPPPLPPTPPPRPAAKPLPQMPELKTPPKSSADMKQIHLDPLSPAQTVDFSEWKKIVKDKCPNLAIVDTIPDDSEARRIQNSWKDPKPLPSILILSFQESAKERAFLNNLTNAIRVNFDTAATFTPSEVSIQYGWDTVLAANTTRLIIANAHGLQAHQELMRHYREMPKAGKFFMGKVPLYLMSDVTLYMREPHLKMSLWQDIRNLLG